MIKLMQSIHDEVLDASATDKIIQQVIYGTGYHYPNEEKIDPRISKVQALIRAKPNSSYSMEELAAEVNLSPTRFIHLFKEQAGVPIRRFRQWIRMKSVMTLVAHGQTLTEAAVASGFTDSAHFSRAFRNMFGITPSTIFSRSQNTRFFLHEEKSDN